MKKEKTSNKPISKYFTTKEGYKIHYLIKRFNNNKPFVYFQHGLTGNHTVWKGHMEYMTKHKQSFIVIDLLGHGDSQKVMRKKCYEVKNQGNYIMQILRHEKITNHIVVGQCYGSMVVLYNEVYRKTESKGLVLVGAPLRNPTKIFVHKKAEPLTWFFRAFFVYPTGILGMILGRRKFYPTIRYDKHINDGRWYIFILDMIGTPKAAYSWSIESMIKVNLVPHLKKIKKPVLLVYGEHDIVPYQEPHAQILESMDVRKTVIIKGIDHLVTMRAPIQLSKEILKFIKEVK
ncbi:alpha/beta hydrolase [Candidatus Woesearchaeota archaeon]|jgi:pimeloyl-ACP methyl ester carboxylesterase|nr:alpha/beta hydrolase [Candidatus Woesearchaeota archaeon]